MFMYQQALGVHGVAGDGIHGSLSEHQADGCDGRPPHWWSPEAQVAKIMPELELEYEGIADGGE